MASKSAPDDPYALLLEMMRRDFAAFLRKAYTAPPAMAFHGAFNLNRNRSPGWRALNSPLPEGCQKLTSSGFRPDRKSNHGLCVTPTNILTTLHTSVRYLPGASLEPQAQQLACRLATRTESHLHPVCWPTIPQRIR